MFWLVLSVAVPIRSVSWTVSVQYWNESCQASATPTSVATDHRRRRHQQGPGVAAQQEVQQEDRGREFQRDGDAEQQPARPRRLARHAVGDHQRHQHDVDLTELEVRPDRLEVDDRRSHDRRRQPAATHPGGSGGDLRAVHDPQPGQHDRRRDDEQQKRDDRDRGAGDRQATSSANGANTIGRQRRIGERQVQAGAGVEQHAVAVERAAVEPGPSTHPVDVDVDAVRRVRPAAASPPTPTRPASAAGTAATPTVGHKRARPGGR